MTRLFFDNVIEQGGSVTAIEAYDSHETVFLDPVKKLVGTYYRKEHPVDKPVIEIDALFIPEFNKLALIIAALRQEDILITNKLTNIKAFKAATKNENPHYVQLLGPSSWNDPALIDKVAPASRWGIFCRFREF